MRANEGSEMIYELIKKHASELRLRDADANKGTYGKLLIIAGSRGMAGAAFLSGLAAYRTGIGMVKYFGTESNRIILQTLLPEAMYESWEPEKGNETEAADEINLIGNTAVKADMPADSKQDAAASAGYIDVGRLKKSLDWSDYVIIGPGLSKNEAARELTGLLFSPEILERLHKKKLIILDADALNIIADEGLRLKDLSTAETGKISNIVITPHVAEMTRLMDSAELTKFTDIASVKRAPEEAAALFGKLHGTNVILKDAQTVVHICGGETVRLNCGCSAMAKAGSGDVLCGFIAGVAAMLKGNIADALPIAVFLHGRAGCIAAENKGEHSTLARDIAEAAGAALCGIAKTY